MANFDAPGSNLFGGVFFLLLKEGKRISVEIFSYLMAETKD
jgi:hypothetical protein